MKIFYIIFSILLLMGTKLSLFEQLKEECGLKENEYMIAVYLTPVSCIKCFVEPNTIINRVKASCPDSKVKVIGLIKCDRDVEMKLFKRQVNWEYPMHRDDGTSREKLGANDNKILTVLNFNGKKKLNIETGDTDKNVRKILNMIE